MSTPVSKGYDAPFLGQMRDVLVVHDSDGLITYVSPSIAQFGYAPQDLLNTSPLDYLHPDDRGWASSVVRQQLSGQLDERVERQARLITADGRVVWIEGRPSLLFDDRGDPVGYMTVVRDVTARHNTNAARKSRDDELHAPLNGILATCAQLRTTTGAPAKALVADLLASAEALRRALEDVPAPTGDTTPPEPAAPVETPRRLKVLAADDHAINLELIDAILEPVAEVTFAFNGRQAVEVFEGGEFDAVLLDVQMPEMDGHDAARAIRASGPRGRQVPIIMVTANGSPGDERLSIQAGADLHIAKPIRAEMLVRAVVDRARQHEASAMAS